MTDPFDGVETIFSNATFFRTLAVDTPEVNPAIARTDVAVVDTMPPPLYATTEKVVSRPLRSPVTSQDVEVVSHTVVPALLVTT